MMSSSLAVNVDLICYKKFDFQLLWKTPLCMFAHTYLIVESAQSASRNVLGMVIRPQLCGICLYYRDSWTLLYVSGVSDLRSYWSVCLSNEVSDGVTFACPATTLPFSTLSSHVIY